MQDTRTKEDVRDSPAERHLTSDKGMGITASSINRLHLGSKRLSGAERKRRRREREAMLRAGSTAHPGPSSLPTGVVSGAEPKTPKRTRSSTATPPSAGTQPVKRPKGIVPEVSYSEALATFKMAIVGTSYPDDKLIESDIGHIQAAILRGLDGAQSGEPLPLLRTFSLQDGALIYYCEDQNSCLWLQKCLNGTTIRDNFVLKVMDAKELPKPVKVAFRTRDLTTSDPKVLLRRVQLLNQGLCTEHWKVVNKQTDPTGQRLILLIDQESAAKISEKGLTAYTGVDKGQFKILLDPNKKATQDAQEAAAGVDDSPESMETGIPEEIPAQEAV